jgi:hypothetical protein
MPANNIARQRDSSRQIIQEHCRASICFNETVFQETKENLKAIQISHTKTLMNIRRNTLVWLK